MLTAVFISISTTPLAFASNGQDNEKVGTHYLEQVKEYCEHTIPVESINKHMLVITHAHLLIL